MDTRLYSKWTISIFTVILFYVFLLFMFFTSIICAHWMHINADYSLFQDKIQDYFFIYLFFTIPRFFSTKDRKTVDLCKET